ncbi:hypothetical protein [Mesorhizobium sp. M0046]|uniref:hypothetical protein n=1 Tax=Mesorhizobium sp. M0046 TaxID=2956858 RepID=UPI003339721F
MPSAVINSSTPWKRGRCGDFPDLERKVAGSGEGGPPEATRQHRGANRSAGEAVHKLASYPVDRHVSSDMHSGRQGDQATPGNFCWNDRKKVAHHLWIAMLPRQSYVEHANQECRSNRSFLARKGTFPAHDLEPRMFLRPFCDLGGRQEHALEQRAAALEIDMFISAIARIGAKAHR